MLIEAAHHHDRVNRVCNYLLEQPNYPKKEVIVLSPEKQQEQVCGGRNTQSLLAHPLP